MFTDYFMLSQRFIVDKNIATVLRTVSNSVRTMWPCTGMPPVSCAHMLTLL